MLYQEFKKKHGDLIPIETFNNGLCWGWSYQWFLKEVFNPERQLVQFINKMHYSHSQTSLASAEDRDFVDTMWTDVYRCQNIIQNNVNENRVHSGEKCQVTLKSFKETSRAFRDFLRRELSEDFKKGSPYKIIHSVNNPLYFANFSRQEDGLYTVYTLGNKEPITTQDPVAYLETVFPNIFDTLIIRSDVTFKSHVSQEEISSMMMTPPLWHRPSESHYSNDDVNMTFNFFSRNNIIAPIDSLPIFLKKVTQFFGFFDEKPSLFRQALAKDFKTGSPYKIFCSKLTDGGHGVALWRQDNNRYVIYDPNSKPVVTHDPVACMEKIFPNLFREEKGILTNALGTQITDLMFKEHIPQNPVSSWTIAKDDFSSFIQQKMLPTEVMLLKNPENPSEILGSVYKVDQEKCALTLKGNEDISYFIQISKASQCFRSPLSFLTAELSPDIETYDCFHKNPTNEYLRMDPSSEIGFSFAIKDDEELEYHNFFQINCEKDWKLGYDFRSDETKENVDKSQLFYELKNFKEGASWWDPVLKITGLFVEEPMREYKQFYHLLQVYLEDKDDITKAEWDMRHFQSTSDMVSWYCNQKCSSLKKPTEKLKQNKEKKKITEQFVHHQKTLQNVMTKEQIDRATQRSRSPHLIHFEKEQMSEG